MIGEIRFPFGRRQCRVVLEDDLAWSSEQAELAELLNHTVPAMAGGPGSPASAARHMLYRAGERLGGPGGDPRGGHALDGIEVDVVTRPDRAVLVGETGELVVSEVAWWVRSASSRRVAIEVVQASNR